MNLTNPDIRYLYDLKGVIYDKKWFSSSDNIELYYMYRGIKGDGSLRYDITVIPPNMLGVEFTKTKGHYHPGNFGELYLVLEGEAIYLMQKVDKNGEIEHIYAVKATKGDSVIIPPKYGHITINPSNKDLKMANWVSGSFESIYEPIEKMGGGGYFYTISGWIKNSNYKDLPELETKKPEKNIPTDLSFLK